MANSRDRRPSDYELPSTDDVIRQIRKGKDRQMNTRHVVVRRSELTSDQDHVNEAGPPASTKASVVKDWILVGLVCLILTLQVWHMKWGSHGTATAEEEQGKSLGELQVGKSEQADNGP